VSRPTIPAEIRRAVLVESGHRCAIPRCGQTELDIHHIIPWETSQKHEYSNLIALCPVCHRRAHNGEIDRRSLSIYKESLAKEFGQHDSGGFKAEVVETRRRIKEINHGIHGFNFQFDFPDFQQPLERIISRNIEAWGYELLVEFRELQDDYIPYKPNQEDPELNSKPPQSTLNGKYHVLRRDDKVVSVRYTIDRYYSGAAHGGRTTRVQNFCVRPFRPLTLEYLLGNSSRLLELANFLRAKLAENKNYDPEWLLTGTEPVTENFSCFNIEEYGLVFTFSEYQIDCFAAGEQRLWVGFHELENICDRDVLKQIEATGL
jgi:hypothetical protein